jgi:TRAP-type C4-dicarboxylate transport system substrate-binding protein
MDKNNSVFYYHEKGNFLSLRESDHDLIVQVFDKPLDELIKEATKQIKENDDAIAEENAEENELQRRKEVVELAEKIWLKNGWYYDAFTDAETFIELKTKYLKDGKLC